jgi:hypothetical protein
MSPDAINAFRLKSAAAQHNAHGVTVRFRNADITAVLSSVRVSLDLELGGNTQGGEYTIRFLTSSLTSKPARGEQVTFGGRRYTISTFGEYVATIQPGSVSQL